MIKSYLNLFSFLLLSFSLLISGCEKDNENKNNNNQGSLKFLTLAGAKSLYISTTSSKKSISADLNKLYKVTEEGLVIEVAYLDENGDTLTTVQSPSSIYNMSDNYILVRFQNGQQYMVRKSDGAVFDASSMPRVSSQGGYPDQEIQRDASGNIYYLGDDNTETNIIKINLTDPENIIVSRYSAASDEPRRFCVDNYGNMAYAGASGSLRYRHAEGGFINNTDGFICTDINNDSIITAKGPGINHYGELYKTQFFKIVPQPFGLVKYGDSATTIGGYETYGNGKITKMKNKNTIIAINGGGTMEIQNPERQPFGLSPEYFGFTPFKRVETLISSDNYYYMLGPVNQNDKPARLVKVNPDDNSFEAYNFSSDYEVYSINVSSDDVPSIYALRLMDGNRVLANLEDGVITVLKVLDSETITSLVQIN